MNLIKKYKDEQGVKSSISGFRKASAWSDSVDSCLHFNRAWKALKTIEEQEDNMEIDRAVYVKAILELVANPSSVRKYKGVQELPQRVRSIMQHLLDDCVFLGPDDYLSKMISDARYYNERNLK